MTVPYKVNGSVGSFSLLLNRSRAPASSATRLLRVPAVPSFPTCSSGEVGHTCKLIQREMIRDLGRSVTRKDEGGEISEQINKFARTAALIGRVICFKMVIKVLGNSSTFLDHFVM